MTIKEFATLINGREYGEELADSDIDIAVEHGFVVVFGASDDLMEFRGAIYDEVGVYEGGTAYLHGSSLYKCENEGCTCAERERAKCKTIEAVWHGDGDPCWTYETDIPHETFDIFEDGEPYCRGIVLDIKDLRKEQGE